MDHLASQAVAPITPGMTVGLGTGRAAARAVHALAARVHAEQLNITCVSTSRATDELAAQLGLTITDFSTVSKVDYLFDGADEVDPHLAMTKGGGGAMTRERIVASAAKRRVYLIDAAKLVPRLGTRAKLPLEVIPMARAIMQARLTEMDLGEGGWRQRSMTGTNATTDFITDNHHLIFDATIPVARTSTPEALATLAAELDALPGLIDHGLFLTECQTLLIEHDGHKIERRDRDV